MEHTNPFPCNGCGACCRRVNLAVEGFKMLGTITPDDPLYFPYTWDETGRCEHLTEDNKCAIYETRPMMCNIDRVMEWAGFDKKKFYKQNAEVCNHLMDQDNHPKEDRLTIL